MIASYLRHKVNAITTSPNGAYAWLVESTTPPGSPPRSLRAFPSTTQKSATAEVATSTPAKRRYAPDTADADVVKKIRLAELELRDRNTVLRGSKPNVCLLLVFFSSSLTCAQNFSAVRTSYADKLKKLREASRSGAPQPATTPGRSFCLQLQSLIVLGFQIPSSWQRRLVSYYSATCLLFAEISLLQATSNPSSSFPRLPQPLSPCTMSSVFYKKQRMNLSLGCSSFHTDTPSDSNRPKRLAREQQRKATLVLKISLLSTGVGQTLIPVARRPRYKPSTLLSIALKHCPSLGRTLGIVLFVL